MKSLVIVPTYQERDNIDALIARWIAAVDESIDLLIVDDGSPDGTAAVVKVLAQARPGIHLRERPSKQGLSSAYLTGFKWAIEHGYEAIVEMDGDLSHDPASIPELLAPLESADLVIGSRYVRGGRIENWGRFRRLLSRAGNLYARLWLGFGIHDSTSGFRAFRRTALPEKDLIGYRSDGYVFQIETTYRVYRNGGRIVEVPITFTERTAGKSKLSRRIVLEAIYHVPALALRNRFRRRSA